MYSEMLLKLSEKQQERLHEYEHLILRYNKKVNLVSRGSTDNFWHDHIQHSLALTYRFFPDGARVVDWGTGGGLPVIPLAIKFPNVAFYAIDAVAKKIQAVRTFARRLGLSNVFAWHGRAEEWNGEAHYSVSRATAPLVDLWSWHVRIAQPLDHTRNEEEWQQGLICLKGGDMTEEVKILRSEYRSLDVSCVPLDQMFPNSDYIGKQIVSVRLG